MNFLISKRNSFFILVAFFVLTSPGLSYSILYPYHLLIPIILLITVSNFTHKGFLANKFTFYLILFFVYCCFSTLFLNSHVLFVNYLVYIFVSFSCMIYVYNYMRMNDNYNLVAKFFSIYIVVVLLIALLESLNIFRLPFSPYSPYYSLFGKTIDISEWSDDVFTYNTQKPTVFASNPNTFGFVLICYLPFVLLFKSKLFKFLLIILSAFIIYKIDSKMLLITFVAFMVFKYLILSEKKFIYFLSTLMLIFFLSPIIVALQNSGMLEGRMFTALDELMRGFDYLSGKSTNSEMDSTGERAYIYSLGIEKFKETYGLGMGWSGIESYLMGFFGKHTAFHNFFLMILVDLGVIGFLVVLLFYFYILKNLYLGFNKYKETPIGPIYEAFLLGVILSIFASITPSGIIYLLPYWFLMGAAAFMAFNYRNINV